jgi:hypothetical protein
MSGLEFTCVLICLGWASFEARMFQYRRYEMSDDFNLSTAERNDLTKATADLAAARKDFTAAEAEVSRLVQMGVGLRRRKSGDFDERNSLGKRLNLLLPPARSKSYLCERQVSVTEATEREIVERPKTRALGWVRWEAWRNASRAVVIGSACLVLLMMILGWAPADNWFYIGLAWFAALHILTRSFRVELKNRLSV